MSGSLEVMLATLAKTQPGLRDDVEELVWTWLGLPLEDKVIALRFVRKLTAQVAQIATNPSPAPSTSQLAIPPGGRAAGNVVQFPGSA